MKNFLIFLITLVSIVGYLFFNFIMDVKNENKELKQKLYFINESINKTERSMQLRNELDDRFYRIIERFLYGDINSVKEHTTENIEVSADKLYNKKLEEDFILPKANFSFRQIYFGFTDETESSYSMIYELRLNDDESYLQSCYVDFILIDGSWKLDEVEMDII